MVTVTNTFSGAGDQNMLVALSEIYQLIQKAMYENAQTQGSASLAMGSALKQAADLITALADKNGTIQDQIASLQSSADTAKSWMIGLIIATLFLGVAAPAAGSLLSGAGMAATVVQASIKVLSALAAIGGGVAGTLEGKFDLDISKLEAQFAEISAALSALNGNQQNEQSASKWYTKQMSGVFSTQANMGKTLASGITDTGSGMSAAGNEITSATIKASRGQKK